jgi:hypothetical protein
MIRKTYQTGILIFPLASCVEGGGGWDHDKSHGGKVNIEETQDHDKISWRKSKYRRNTKIHPASIIYPQQVRILGSTLASGYTSDP